MTPASRDILRKAQINFASMIGTTSCGRNALIMIDITVLEVHYPGD